MGKPTPKDRISSNFFTVPVKKATESTTAYYYPHRPKKPLLKIGKAATGIEWGIDYHTDWRDNLPQFITEVKSNTPFTDLAIFIFRHERLPEGHDNVRDALCSVMQERFGEGLVEFLSRRMDAEKIFFKHGDDPFSAVYQDSLTESPFSAVGGVSNRDELQTLDKTVLVDRVVYLESLLAAHDIDYQN